MHYIRLKVKNYVSHFTQWFGFFFFLDIAICILKGNILLLTGIPWDLRCKTSLKFRMDWTEKFYVTVIVRFLDVWCLGAAVGDSTFTLLPWAGNTSGSSLLMSQHPAMWASPSLGHVWVIWDIHPSTGVRSVGGMREGTDAWQWAASLLFLLISWQFHDFTW